MKLVGRDKEKAQIKEFYNSGKAEFITVLGRRRIGKTFLIKETLGNNFSFYFSGSIGKNITAAYQLRLFDKAIEDYGGNVQKASKNWADAFYNLKQLVKDEKNKRQVIFIDELPWLDTPKSDFLPALDYFWNTFASERSDILLVVCGSAASWLVKNLFENKGGLHNRVTGRIWLKPFTLSESEAFFNELGVVMNRYQIAESDMIFGGIPYYLNMFAKAYGLTQNVDRLLFAENAPLRNEFHEVYSSLFKSSDRHIKIVTELSKKKYGLTRDEIIRKTGIPGGGNLTKTLSELEHCGFIDKYSDFTKKSANTRYRLIDPFTLFWLRYVENNEGKDEYFWTNLIDDGGRRAWSGFAFEMLCLRHLTQIKSKLGILGVSTSTATWQSKNTTPGAQIDLLISRKDGVINICECKYSVHPFEISSSYAKTLEWKKTAFKMETHAKQALHITLVTTYGVARKGQFTAMQSEVTLDDLF